MINQRCDLQWFNDDLCLIFRLRLAGLHGLQGVVRKTVTDDLQCNIWKPVHMDKIIPSLLFNMQDARYNDIIINKSRNVA